MIIAAAQTSAAPPMGPRQATGYRVIVNRLGAAPLDQSSVVSVRPGRQITQRVTDSGGDSVERVLYTTIYVDVR
jgi:hypothetical protein